MSADYPDVVQPIKTRAVETLVRLVDDRFDNHIVSLNRTGSLPGFARALLTQPARPELAIAVERGPYGLDAVRYGAPPLGIFHGTMLHRLGDWLANHLSAAPRPGLLVGHKLTVEGVAVRHAARLLGVPYALSIQGDTDTKILATRPDLRPLFARCFHEAAVVFPFAPWTLARVEAMLGKRAGETIVIPCPVTNDEVIAPQLRGDGLVSAFHLQSYRRKNLARMAAASNRLCKVFPDARVTIIGGGNPADRRACARVSARHPAVILEGPQPLARMPARFNRASGFVLASKRESFGLVFIEALFAGLPVAYPAGWAVDGFLDGLPFAQAVDNRSTESIAEGMIKLLREEENLKRSLAEWQSGPGPARFKRATIADQFAGGLARAAGLTVETP